MSQVIPMLDTHQHLIYPDKWPYSWTQGIPALEGKRFHYEDYVRLTSGKGVAGTLFMESSPDDPHWHAETRFVYELAEMPGSLIRGIIANCRPEAEGFKSYIDSIRHPKLVGFRRILHVVPDDTSQHPNFAENVRWLGTQGFTYDLCFLERQLPLGIDLARKCPDTQLIVNHCGCPEIADGQLDPWRQHIRQLAELPNVACKLSGVIAYTKPGEATIETIRPWVEHCIECFGPDRLVWGSDWPVCEMGSTLPGWIDMARQLVSSFSESEQRKILHDNALRIYRVKP